MKKITVLTILVAIFSIAVKAQELPANPIPGKCYIKCITKDEYKELTETFQISPSYKKLKVVPATYKTVEERVLIKEAGKKQTVIPATYKTVEERMLLKEASKTQSMIPATFKTVEERMLVKEASKKLVVIPATYKTVEERILEKEAYKKMVFKPATFKTEEERILVKEAVKKLTPISQSYSTETVSYLAKEAITGLEVIPAKFSNDSKTFITKEKSGKWEYTLLADCPSANKEDCMTLCYVETPEQTENVPFTKLDSDATTRVISCNDGGSQSMCEANSSYKKQVLSNPARTSEVEIPAEYSTFKRQVIATSASYEEIDVPAVYTTIKKQVVATPARVEEVEIPAEYAVVKSQVIATPARVEEVEVPAQYSTVKKQIVDTPARVEEVEIPAEYATIKKQVLDTPAYTTEEIVPAITKTVTKTVLVSKGGITVWEEVDCSLVGTNNILNILYEYNSARLTPTSTSDIDNNLLKLMKDKPNLRVEIMSHTDSRGNDDYNMSLSQQRAQSVVNYLVNKGISRDRLVAKGFGETRLKNKCSNGVSCSDDQHQENRRTEFRIIQ